MQFPKLTRKHIGAMIGVAVLIIAGVIMTTLGSNSIDIENPAVALNTLPSSAPEKNGILNGRPCARSDQRPLAVMYASDPEARPLSGIGSTDMVIEMPVTQNGVTRMMALFQCQEPSEYGSIRSARLDFIPFVIGFDALYLHWGGEQDALARLDAGATNNIDCLKLDGTTCRRKSNRPRPHNGFSTPALLRERIAQVGYRTTSASTPYLFDEKPKSAGVIAPPTLYSSAFTVRWTYDPVTNRYTRFRGGSAELDALTTLQVQADNIVVMNTTSEYVSILYNRVKTVGNGTITLYRNGTTVSGTWKKLTDTDRLVFTDASGKELKLNPGTTWIEVVTQ